MKDQPIKQLVKIIRIPKITDDAELLFAQIKDHIPFPIKRVYTILNPKAGEPRGCHAHHETEQILFCLKGKVKMILDDGFLKSEIWLTRSEDGILLPPLVWHEMQEMTPETVLLVLASKIYDPGDYIRSLDQFKKIVREKKLTPTAIKFNDFKAEYKLRGTEYEEDISRVLSSGWYVLGNEVKQFESELAGYLGVKQVVGVANGLEALQIALMAKGVGQGGEVITTPLSAMATTLAILAVGAKPVFVDTTDQGLLNLDLVEKQITQKTKAILPVHLYGQSENCDELLRICQKYKLFLIEDACQAHGTQIGGKMAGSFGDAGCFSFYPTKNLGALGDGGAIATNDDELAAKCRMIRDYGQEKKYLHCESGLNSRLDELQAAVLRTKLKYLDTDNARRREMAEIYRENLLKIKGVEMIGLPTWENNNFHLVVIKVKNRDGLQDYLSTKGIATLVHYPLTIPDQPLFKGKYKSADLPVARKLVKEILSLPCHSFMTNDQAITVCEKINEFLNQETTQLPAGEDQNHKI